MIGDCMICMGMCGSGIKIVSMIPMKMLLSMALLGKIEKILVM